MGSPDGVEAVGGRAQSAHRKADLQQEIVDVLGQASRQADDPAAAVHGLLGPGGRVRVEVQLLQSTEEFVAASYQPAARLLAAALDTGPAGHDLVRDRA